jgi:hypothetical protein
MGAIGAVVKEDRQGGYVRETQEGPAADGEKLHGGIFQAERG